jgi:hypothetical protein
MSESVQEVKIGSNAKGAAIEQLLGRCGGSSSARSTSSSAWSSACSRGATSSFEGCPGSRRLWRSARSPERARSFRRIQFTPDLLPADLTGTLIYNQKDGTFVPAKGRSFANFVSADEINRAPAKVQSALLEAMQERQVTIGDTTYPLPSPFLVLATQNPIEQEGPTRSPRPRSTASS